MPYDGYRHCNPQYPNNSTACFDDPYAPIKVRDGLAALAERQGLNKVSDFTGAVVPW